MSKANVLLGHGSGGRLSRELFEQVFRPAFQNAYLDAAHDGAVFPVSDQRLAFSTDTFVVKPIFFPGGNIGDLAVNGTVNDIAMCGAHPLYLSAGFILEEGFTFESLERIVQSMKRAADEAGVKLVTGDTKVVERGGVDGLFINTAGIGRVFDQVDISPRNAAVGDVIILSGRIADHGIAVLSRREGLEFESEILSDTAPLNRLVETILDTTKAIHVLRDPTRGGVAAALNEIAASAEVGIELIEDRIPMAEPVRAVSEILGLDPMIIANEGKTVVVLPEESSSSVLAAMRSLPVGRDSAIIGRVVADHPARVVMETRIGTRRIVEMPLGEQLPRIC